MSTTRSSRFLLHRCVVCSQPSRPFARHTRMWLFRCQLTPTIHRINLYSKHCQFGRRSSLLIRLLRARSVPEGSDSQHMDGQAPGVSSVVEPGRRPEQRQLNNEGSLELRTCTWCVLFEHIRRRKAVGSAILDADRRLSRQIKTCK